MSLYYNKDERVGQGHPEEQDQPTGQGRPGGQDLRENGHVLAELVEALEAAARAAEPRSARTTVRRRAGRGHYDRETVDAILDEGLVAHVAFVSDGHPFAIPM